jgi:hypothetical protein
MRHSVARVCRRALLELSDSVGLVAEVLRSSFFWFIIGCSFASMYAFVTLYVAYLLKVNAWIIMIPPLIPFTTVWLLVLRKRANSYLAFLLAPQKDYDIEKTLKEYAELLEKQKKM